MKRIEPPAAAAWVLEHLTPADRDEALAGDLLEDYRAGRSDGWYWRQAMAAFAVAWGRYFAQRRSLLLFVLLWSMMAPAWTAIVDGIERHAGFAGPIWRMDAPFSTLSTLGLWLLLHLTFLWAGIVVYFAGFARSGGTLRVKSMVQVPLPRPRNIIELQKAAEFGELVHRIWSGLRDEVQRAREQENKDVVQ